MLFKSAVILLSAMFIRPLWAFTCYYTFAKANCWTKYNVTVDVIDAKSTKVLTTVTVPAGKSWTRASFNCETNGQTLMYRAQFSPVIWDNDKGKVFYAKNYLSLPHEVNPKDSAWNISVCYPKDFSQVPIPPNATYDCACDFSTIPVIKMRQLN